MIPTPTAQRPVRAKERGRSSLTDDARLTLYRFMKLTRASDEMILRLYKQGKIVGGAYTGTGNEATAVGSAFALQKVRTISFRCTAIWEPIWSRDKA